MYSKCIRFSGNPHGRGRDIQVLRGDCEEGGPSGLKRPLQEQERRPEGDR